MMITLSLNCIFIVFQNERHKNIHVNIFFVGYKSLFFQMNGVTVLLLQPTVPSLCLTDF